MTWPPPRPPWWVAIVAVGIAVAVLVWALNGRRAAAKAKEAADELHRGQLADLNAAHAVERGELLADLVREASASADLAEELARIKATWPTATPVATAHGSTPWKPVGPAAGGAGTPSPPADNPGASPPVPAPACPACRLLVTDEVQVRASGAALETDLGNIAVAAVASVWRRPAGGGPEEELHSERLKLDVQVEEHRATLPGWGAGAALIGFGGSTGGGWFGAVLVSPPPLRLLGAEGSLLVGGGVGGGGSWGGLAGALLRW